MKFSYLLMGFIFVTGLSACGGGGGSDAPAPTFTIQVGNFPGGSLSPSSVTVAQGQATSFTVTPDVGFELVTVTGCGGTLTGNTYRTGPINSVCSINATFSRKRYEITAAAADGGTINPIIVSVAHGETTSFDVLANTGFTIAEVSGCAGTLAGNRYTTGAITSACEISARFSALSFEVNATTTGDGGNISPTQQLAKFNERLTFTLAPNSGFTVESVTGCGGSLNGLSYITAPISAACDVVARFAPAAFNVTGVATSGGSVTPGNINVLAGGSAEFIITPEAGFRLKQVDGCEGRFEGNRYIVAPVNADCTLVAQFNPAERVEFADAQLSLAVKSALGLAANEPILAERLAQLTELNANSRAITRLDGLQYARSLRTLSLMNNQISNFSVLNLLSSDTAPAMMVSLYVSGNPITHLPTFARLANLQNLSLENTQLTVLPDVSALAALRYFNLAYNRIRNFDALSGLQLTSLDLSGNPAADNAFGVLSGMPLTSLRLSNTNFKTAEQLSSIATLRDLSANYTQLSNLAPLKPLQNLNWLSIYGSQVFDLNPLLDMFPTNNAGIYVGGCFKTTGFSRANQVIDTLSARGNFVQVLDWARPASSGCNTPDIITDGQLSAVLSNSELTLNWSLQSADLGPWRCELHLNLDNQQARVPVQVLEDCHKVRSWNIPAFPAAVAEPYLVIDNGLVRQRTQLAAGRVIKSDGLPDPYLDSTQWLQIVAKTNPLLVPFREAKLRVHILSASGKAPPAMTAVLRDGNTSIPLAVTAPIRLPQQRQAGSLDDSYQVTLPAQLAKPGVELVLEVAGLPAQRLQPAFASLNSIDLTLVPLKLGDKIATLPENSLIEDSLLTVWPFANVNITRREPFTLAAAASSNNNFTMLNELYDLQVAEGENGFYYGYYTRDMNNDQWGGMAYRPGITGVGLVPFGDIDFTLSHELGHNLGLQHAPCGLPSGVDEDFPYPEAGIGTFGVPRSFNRLLSPAVFKDLMSYCGNEHVSDYNLELVQDFMAEQQSSGLFHQRDSTAEPRVAQASVAPASNIPAMFYRFKLNDQASVEVLQAMQLPHTPRLSANSRYQVMAEFNQGAPLVFPVELLVYGHGSDAEQISFTVPLSYNNAALVSWALYDGQRMMQQHQLYNDTATVAMAAPAVRIDEQHNEVCVSISSRFDGANLAWHKEGKITMVALSEQQPRFCRSTEMIGNGGAWVVQTRLGLAVQQLQLNR